MSASPPLILVVETNMDRQTATLHSPFTVVGSGSSRGSDSPLAGSEGTCMVGEKEAQVTSWWVVTNDLWVNGLALLTFDP